MKENQKIEIIVDGVARLAEVVDIIQYNENEYALYSIINDEETSDLFVSKIKHDEAGNDILVDIEDAEEKRQVFDIVSKMFS